MLPPKFEKLPEVFSPLRLMEVFGVCKSTAYRMVNDNGLVTQFGHRQVVSKEDLRQFLTKSSEKAATAKNTLPPIQI